jgi:DNA-directed RNA polymerase subunit RPC12/RpoP
MPVSRLVCPHCEREVELNVTTVARSRPCPDCGSTILLQVAGRDSSTKLKSVFTNPSSSMTLSEVATGTATVMTADGVELMRLRRPAENAFEHLRRDPEVIHSRRLFWMGLGIVTFLVSWVCWMHQQDAPALLPVKTESSEQKPVKPLDEKASVDLGDVPVSGVKGDPIVPEPKGTTTEGQKDSAPGAQLSDIQLRAPAE